MSLALCQVILQQQRVSETRVGAKTHISWQKMVLPVSIMRAACDGDSAKVWAWLDDPDAVEPRDVNDRSNTGAGTTLLMAATMFLDSFAKLDFVHG